MTYEEAKRWAKINAQACIAIANICDQQELSYLDDEVITRIEDIDFRALGEMLVALADGPGPKPEFAEGIHVYLRYSAQGVTDEGIEITLPANVVGRVEHVEWCNSDQGWQYTVAVAGIVECLDETNRINGKLPIEKAD